MLSFIPNGSNNNECTAVEWVLHVLFDKYEDEFVSVAIKKGVAILEDKMMDAATVSAMLEDCNINLTNSRKLFCHLSQFFGRQIAVLENEANSLKAVPLLLHAVMWNLQIGHGVFFGTRSLIDF